MKLKEIFYLLGFKPKTQTYGTEVVQFTLPEEGVIDYACWMHPMVGKSEIGQQTVDALRSFLRPGDVAIDIGAFTGDTAVPMALVAGKEGCVIALEPNRYVFPTLKRNSELNPTKTRILPLMFAATRADAELEFEYSDPGYCNGGRHEGISPWKHAHAFKLKVQGRNLEAYLRTNHADLLPRLRYVKVDAEGFDRVVLESIAGLLKEFRPYVRAEVFKRTTMEQRLLLLELMLGMGYTVYKFGGDTGYQGEPVTRENLMAWKHYDIFCVPSR